MNQPRQRQLPLPWHLVRPLERSTFAHPAEQELANLLSFYRVRWLYEPTNFVLEWSPDGRPVQSFTPDFYLPEHRLYIELTTMRQPLVTRKNRKLRLLREMYPGVQIKLLYRRDVERLLSAYQRRPQSLSAREIGDVVATSDQLQERIGALSLEIFHWHAGEGAATPAAAPLHIIGIAPGALTFKRHLVNALRAQGIEIEVDRVMTTRYRTPGGRNHVRMAKAPRSSVAGKDVLVVADMVSTGLSIGYLVRWLRRNGARRVEVCSLLTRSQARLIELPVRFTGFEAPDAPIVGFGSGNCASHRALDYIATLQDSGS